MAEQAYAYVTLIPVAKGFKNSIEKELGGIDGIGGDIGSKTGGSFANGFGKSLKSMAVVAGSALAAVGVGQFFKESITQASDLGESINAVNKAYGDYAGDVLKLGGDVANRLGLSTVDFNAAAVRFSSFAERVVGKGGDVAGFVDDLTTRAADFASVYNIDVSEALQVFQSGLSGEAEPLKRFGINLLDSEVKAYAYANGIAAVGTELTETQKTQARYGLLLESTNKTAGDFADTSDGLANSQRILSANLENLQATVGAGLTPIFATFTSALVPLANVIFPALANFLNTYIAPGLQRAADAFKAFAETAGEGGASIGNILQNIQQGLIDFVEGGGLAQMFERIAEFRMQFFEAISKALPGIIDAMVEFIPVILSFLFNDLLPALVNELTGIITELANLLIELAPTIINALVGLIPELLEAAVSLFESLIKAVVEITPMLVETLVELIPVIITALVDNLPMLIEGAMKFFAGLVTAIIDSTPEIIRATLGLVPVIVKALIDSIPQLIRAGIDLLAGLAKGIIDNAPRILGAAVGAIGETLVNGVKDFLGIRSPSRVFQTIGEYVGDGLVVGLNNSQSKVSAAADALSKKAVPAGFEWVVGPNGPYLERTSVTRGAETRDESPYMTAVGSTATIAANLSAQGYNQAQIDKIFQSAVGGTAKEIANSFRPGTELINKKTGMITVGNIQGQQLADLLAQGYVEVGKVAASQDELSDALRQLTDTIQSGGAGVYLASGGLVTGPTQAVIGEAGPEVVIPLDRFEKMMGMSEAGGKTVNYYAAPNQSIDAEQSLFQAMRRAKVVANW